MDSLTVCHRFVNYYRFLFMPSRNDPINVIISRNISCNAIISELNALLLVEKLTCGNYFKVGVL